MASHYQENKSAPLVDLVDLEDDLEQVIQDSMDVDWTSRTGAKAVIDKLIELGLVRGQ